MKSFLRTITILLFSVALHSSIQAESLSEKIANAKCEWLMGNWGDKASEGQGIKFSFAWILEKHAIRVKVSSPDMQAEGMATLEPGTDKLSMLTVDTTGAVAVGQWGEHNGNPFLKVKHKSPSGEEKDMGVEYVKVDENSLKVRIYKLGADGKPEDDPSGEIEFIRVKE